jgi:hypothetical protein
MKILNRIILFFSLIILYIIVKEFLELYVNARSLHPIIGYLTLIALGGFVFYFVAIPIHRIIKIPKHYGPSKNKDEIPQLLTDRIDNYKTNKHLIKTGFDFSAINYDGEGYQKIIDALTVESKKIREKYVKRLFYSSTVARNGFIDAILILSSAVNMIKEIFILYNGRVTNKDLLTIGKKVYYAMAISGSEGVQVATEEIMHSLAIKGFNSIPFIDKIVSSLTDGFVNAVLLTRVAFITENYCKLLYIESEKELYPSPRFVIDTTNHITADIKDKIRETLKKMRDEVVDKTVEFALNPAAYVLSKSVDAAEYVSSGTSSLIKDGITLAASPFAYVLMKSTNVLKRNKEASETAEPEVYETKPSIRERLRQARTSTKDVFSRPSDGTKRKKMIDRSRRIASGTASIAKGGYKHTKNSLNYVFSKSSDALKKIKKRKKTKAE